MLRFQSLNVSIPKPMIHDPLRDLEKAEPSIMTATSATLSAIPQPLRGLTLASFAVSTAALAVSLVGVALDWPFYYLYGITISFVLTWVYHVFAIAHHNRPTSAPVAVKSDMSNPEAVLTALRSIVSMCAAPAIAVWWIGSIIQVGVSLHRVAYHWHDVTLTVVFLSIVELGAVEAVLMTIIAFKQGRESSSRGAISL